MSTFSFVVTEMETADAAKMTVAVARANDMADGQAGGGEAGPAGTLGDLIGGLMGGCSDKDNSASDAPADPNPGGHIPTGPEDWSFLEPPNYGQSMDSIYASADSVYQWIDRYFRGDSTGTEPLEDLRFEDFDHTEFDAESYEETVGRHREVEVSDPNERLQNATLADDPSVLDPVEPDFQSVPIPQRGSGRYDDGG